MAPKPRVATIAPSAPFLPTLVRALMDGTLVPGLDAASDPLALAAATLYLPTRRACRLARDLFADHAGTEAAILPRIVAIGDIDEDEFVFADQGLAAIADTVLDMPPPLTGSERRFLLARLVMKWAGSPELHGSSGAPLVAHSPAAALALADDLARLIDDMTTRQVPWERLDGLVPDHLDAYWQLSLRFLQIARTQWPAILADRKAIEPAARRDILIAAEAARLAATSAPVIAAGSTGSMPATAALLETVARLPHGVVVLPGLDTDLDAAAWTMIAGEPDQAASGAGVPCFGHPQFAMRVLLGKFGIDRADVAVLGRAAAHGRERLLSEALRPAAATERWKERLDDAFLGRALGDIAVIEAGTAEEEALAIAVALREAAEDLDKRAALVTPDRRLARRVVMALGRWGIAVDDSGGDPLGDTAAGIFARLVADAGLGGLAPVTLLALLKHRAFRCGAAAGAHDRAIAGLELALLRGPRPRPGTAGLAHALTAFRRDRANLHPSDPRTRLAAADLDAAAALIARLAQALAPLEQLDGEPKRFGEIAARHRDAVAALGADPAGRSSAFGGEDGAALAEAFDEFFARDPAADLVVAPPDYGDLFGAAIAGAIVRRAPPAAARIAIFGLLEARLQVLDRIVLGGLVEGTWPPEARSDPWLSRPMRQNLGLDLPERRIGLSAHDFAQALGTPQVTLSRAVKVAGVPTVASRFMQRLAAVAGADRWAEALARGERYLALARTLDRPARVERMARPAPRPPRDARPARLSVTDVEHWLRDPYTIYAKHVLRLAPIDPVDTAPGARDRGNLIHDAVGEFIRAYPAALPADPVAELLQLGRARFAPLEDYPEVQAFWWPRFVRIAAWFAAWDRDRRAAIGHSSAEIRGEIAIPLGARTFRLAARADRIDRRADGRYLIVDYKTGEARSEKQVRTGLAPQLTLEAAILRHGGFADIAAGASVAAILYVTLKGGNPPGRERPIDFEEGDADSQADAALARFVAMARRFENDDEPYRSLVHPMWTTQYGDYDHLARVKEWSASGGVAAEGDE